MEKKYVAYAIMSYFWIQGAVVNVPQIMRCIGTSSVVRLFEILNRFRSILFLLQRVPPDSIYGLDVPLWKIT